MSTKDLGDLGVAAGDIIDKAFTLGYETGRKYVPPGGVALTAEQVEDVRIVLGLNGSQDIKVVLDAQARLRALFPATEPDEEETKAAAWDEGFEAGAEFRVNQVTPSGESIDPPLNPYDERNARYFSSPVVPAPTETEWQTWQEVPRGQTVRAANGERFRKNSVGAIHLLTNGLGDCCQVYAEVNSLPAPFFAVKEES